MRTLLMALAAFSVATPVAAENWNPFSRSTNNVFMADADSITAVDGLTSVKVATVSRGGDRGDYSHSVETYELQCDADKWRTAGIVEFGPDGTEADRYPEEGAEWESIRPGTMPEFLHAIACGGSRAEPPTWPSIKAFVDAGRP